MTNQSSGESGEKEIIGLVPCPNCGKSLMQLPKNYPLYDLQCTGCSFRAQVKTNNSKPKNEIFGAGWDIIEKVLKSGFMIPPLIANFKWAEKGIEKQKIIFYPFIPKNHLKKRILPSTARRANYKMFNYVGLDELANFVLFEK
ncbi:MAG: DpnI domain-containing protein [Candidatus ainarchaeum sp.]|nr:DpnI domain-containing protein [Candidatus ainarchaeum sp.]